MNRQYSRYVWISAAWLAAFAVFPLIVSAQDMRVKGKNIPLVKEQAVSVAAANGADARVVSMPNPVTTYPVDEGYPMIGWETLASFPYDATTGEEQRNKDVRLRKKRYPIPAFITDLNGTKAAVTGFMIPIDTDKSGVNATAFIIVRNQMSCCFGVVPMLNEYMMVTMKKGKKAKIVMDVPMTVYGTLETGEKFENGVGWTLYRMSAVKTKLSKQF
jgi:hypothetical protein